MGGRGRSRTQRKHCRQNRENVWKRPKSDASADATQGDDAQNPSFDEYYKEQEIVSPEEWDDFIGFLRKPLPAAFRINSSSRFYLDIRSQLQNDFMNSLQAEDAVDAIKPLPWYPDNLAWQPNFSRNQLRKNQTIGRFHEFLDLENEIGNITRQEAVSMVHPLFLDVRPEHFVLDMCAAPGLKTFQLLEMIHNLTEPAHLPSGMIIANDPDVQRCNLLIRQTKRMCTSNLIVTNHEAQHFPSCHLRRSFAASHPENFKEPGINQLQFDRVLCDVPCSGDGTLRKASDIWQKWNAGMGNRLHGVQVLIAMRGLALLKVGGRMVYSTCSMNPVENEAVVAEVLRRCEGAVELLDVSSEHPQLLRRPGVKKWKVCDKGQWFASCKDVPRYRRSVAHPGMFPSGKSVETSEQDAETENEETCTDVNETMNEMKVHVVSTKNLEAEVSDLPLERCMRIVPHDQNSGALFIAVLQKVSSLPAAEKKEASAPNKVDTGNNQPEDLTSEVKEDTNGGDIDLTTEMVARVCETAPVADVMESGTDGASLDTDQNNEREESEKEQVEPSADMKTGSSNVGRKRKLQQMQGKWRGADPVIFYKDDAVVNSIIEFYGIKESFPIKGHLITRHDDMNHVKRIYYVSDSVKRALELNLLAGQQLKIASVGLKMFEGQLSQEGSSAPYIFRISPGGLPLILPHVTKQILYASAVDFKHLLLGKNIEMQDFVEPGFAEKASNLLLGCCLVVLNKECGVPADTQPADALPIAIRCWKGISSLTVMATAVDCLDLLERLFTEDTPTPSIPEGAAENCEANGSDMKEDN